MIFPDKWAAQWVAAWNAQDLEGLLALYAESIQLQSPFAKLYAGGGLVRGKANLRTYWGEVMRRLPNLKLELVAVYSGHLALAFQYRDDSGRNVIETVLFDENDKAVFESACLDQRRN